MESYAETVGMIEKPDVDPCNNGTGPHLILADILKRRFFDRFLFFAATIVEYTFGIHIGFAVGWLLGWVSGNVYVEHFEPVYLVDLSELSRWRVIPNEFARNGAILGVAVGVIVIAIINNKLLSQRVISLYKKESKDSKDIARTLDKSARQIERKINKLVREGKIIRNTDSDIHNRETLIERKTK